MGRVRLLVRKTLSEYGADRCTHMAAAISYYVVFSLFPLVVFVVAMGSFFFDREEVKEKVLDGINRLVPTSREGEENQILDVVDGVVNARGALGGLAFLGVALSASAMFGALRTSLNIAWDVEQSRPLVLQKLLDLAAAGGIGLLFFLSVGATTVLQVVRNATDRLGPLSDVTGAGWDAVFALLPVLLSLLLFTILYRFVPNTRVRWHEAFLGGVFATLLFEMAKNAFALYLGNFGNYNETYGSLGAVVVFLFWVYLSAAIILLGAELTSEIPRVWRGDYDAEEAQRARPQATCPPYHLWLRTRRAIRHQLLGHSPKSKEGQENEGRRSSSRASR